MSEHKVQVKCRNNGETLEVAIGTTLQEVYSLSGLQMEYGPICAKVNNKVEGMHYRLYKNKNVEFLDLHNPSGQRTYTRTLFFILCKAATTCGPTAASSSTYRSLMATT